MMEERPVALREGAFSAIVEFRVLRLEGHSREQISIDARWNEVNARRCEEGRSVEGWHVKVAKSSRK